MVITFGYFDAGNGLVGGRLDQVGVAAGGGSAIAIALTVVKLPSRGRKAERWKRPPQSPVHGRSVDGATSHLCRGCV